MVYSTNEIPALPGAYQLIKGSVVIYVGKASNLRERISDHRMREDNPLIRISGWDRAFWQPTLTEAQAAEIERRWFLVLNPCCNRNTPPNMEISPLLKLLLNSSAAQPNRTEPDSAQQLPILPTPPISAFPSPIKPPKRK